MPVTWTDAAERDLLLAMLINSAGKDTTPSQVRVPWGKVVEIMNSFGYETTKQAPDLIASDRRRLLF